MSRKQRLATAIVLQILIAAGEILFGLFANSVALLADAGHNLVDAGGIALSLFAVYWATAPRDERKSYGGHRATILAALANVALISLVTVGIVVESIIRLLHPEKVDGLVVMLAAIAALILNGVAALVLNDKTSDLNMRTSLFHAVADVMASLAVVMAGIVLVVDPSFVQIDAIVPLLIAVFILYIAYGLLKESIDVLMENTPAGIDPSVLQAEMEAVAGVESVHDLHIWSLSREYNVLSGHIVVQGHPTLEEAQVVSDSLKDLLTTSHGIAHVTLELECEPCEQIDESHNVHQV